MTKKKPELRNSTQVKTLPLRWYINRDIELSCSHELKGLPKGHKCERNHGHNYKVCVRMSASQLDEVGFVIDFGLIKAMLVEKYDHRLLNECMKKNPTVENFALDILETINDMLFKAECDAEVRVEEIDIEETGSCRATLVVEHEYTLNDEPAVH